MPIHINTEQWTKNIYHSAAGALFARGKLVALPAVALSHAPYFLDKSER
jgi:hypothetical protein